TLPTNVRSWAPDPSSTSAVSTRGCDSRVNPAFGGVVAAALETAGSSPLPQAESRRQTRTTVEAVRANRSLRDSFIRSAFAARVTRLVTTESPALRHFLIGRGDADN